MNTTQSATTSRIKNIALAACAVMATTALTAGDAAAQCRIGGGNSGYGYGSSYSGYGYNGANSGYGNRYNNGRSYGSDSYTSRGSNSRLQNGYNQGHGLTSYRGLSSQRPSLSFGLTYNGNRDSGFNTGYNNSGYSNRSGYGTSYYTNTRQPASYRNGDRFGAGYSQSRSPLNRAGY